MKLRNILAEAIVEDQYLDEKSDAGKKAKQMGLDYMSFGRWGKAGKVTHKSEKGKLVPITKTGAEKATGMKFGRGKNANTMYSPKTGAPSATYDKETGRMSSLRKRTPDQQKNIAAAKQQLGPDGDALARRAGIDADKGYAVNAYSGLSRKVDDAMDSGNIAYDTEYSPSEFIQRTGLKPVEFKFMVKHQANYDPITDVPPAFEYDESSNSVSVPGDDYYYF